MGTKAEIKSIETGYQLGNFKTQGLATRESQALLLIANGYSHKAAAREMGCGVKNIDGRIQNLFYKLRASSGPQLIAEAFKKGKLQLVEA